MKILKASMVSALIVSLAAFPVSALANPVTESADLVSQSLNVTHFEGNKVSSDRISSIVQTAKGALQQEKNSKTSLTVTNTTYDNTTYNYVTFDEQHIYFYEESANSKPELIITDNDQSKSLINEVASELKEKELSSRVTPQVQSDFIDDGVGGKITISQTGSPGSYLSTKLAIPTTSQVSSDLARYSPYNYGGFEYSSGASGGVGSWAADMGLSYYNNLGPNSNQWGWKPIIILKKKTQPTKDGWTQYASNLFPDSNNLEGQYKNGYKPGTDAILYIWYNNDGKVRLKVDGTTISPTRQGTTLSDTHNITIIDSNASWNIPQISAWKLLSTVVSSDNTGRNKAIYSSIKINGNDVANSYFSTPQEDHATVSRSGNTVTINVQ
ncbi:YrpD family protein [Paenibacillus terrae]|uniref:Uncharacterized protein n=1 Tax=Paenibacillus terrae TaxID=159743 RepID=A0A0D7X8U6_9BACL|nr:YrpD family protein [Paenibacillus terrae]KJD47428.1 hypothetical protein QD47_00265 [Paenibacillus terrae]